MLTPALAMKIFIGIIVFVFFLNVFFVWILPTIVYIIRCVISFFAPDWLDWRSGEGKMVRFSFHASDGYRLTFFSLLVMRDFRPKPIWDVDFYYCKESDLPLITKWLSKKWNMYAVRGTADATEYENESDFIIMRCDRK